MDDISVRKFASSVGLVVGHLGFCPKYRNKIFTHEEIKKRFVELLHEVEKRHYAKYKIHIHEIGVDVNHAHAIVKSGMNCIPAKITQLFKGYTSKKLFEEFPWLRRRYFWGGKMWTKSHYYKTTGPANYNVVRNYSKCL